MKTNSMPYSSFTSFSAILASLLVLGSCAGHDFVEARPTLTHCGGFLNESEGEIMSPGYPRGYPSDQLCIWLIEVPVYHYVRLELHFVDLEQATINSCWDFIEVREGNKEGTLYGIECHRYSMGRVSSKSRWMWVKFKSDAAYEGAGFLARWSSVPGGDDGESYTAPFLACGHENQWRCGNYECIPANQKCNRKNNCGDMSDELDCGPIRTKKKTLRLVVAMGAAVFVVFIIVVVFNLYVCKCKQRMPGRGLARHAENDATRHITRSRAVPCGANEGREVVVGTVSVVCSNLLHDPIVVLEERNQMNQFPNPNTVRSAFTAYIGGERSDREPPPYIAHTKDKGSAIDKGNGDLEGPEGSDWKNTTSFHPRLLPPIDTMASLPPVE